jgi:hypothetical protein
MEMIKKVIKNIGYWCIFKNHLGLGEDGLIEIKIT